MKMRIGVSRQQYQCLESKGNPRLNTLELVAGGLNSELMLIPKNKLNIVKAVLEKVAPELDQQLSQASSTEKRSSLLDDLLQGLMGDD